ncbi:endonuclease/exonuclease/phosphatase family protein [Marinomonas aquiplantarum]|uniref:Endonuclease/exonuclease/phosphatase domain-containing protein n=1 Tax=Marinomonas aquiplantarum TaxID=491951 RepID=A0A366CXP5_9GAMM|nr:endonuclease/exonuclease/phosphatase family protein [Marinomonas aquiplantarum]RBO82611.1 hypothetical protein DFP76_10576 [Marinomonas aquiplantarum]
MKTFVTALLLVFVTGCNSQSMQGGERSGGGGSDLFSFSKENVGAIRVIGYNVEGGYKSEASVDTVVENMTTIGYADIWALSEVTVSWEDELLDAVGDEFTAISTNGAIDTTDTLMLLIDTGKFRLLSTDELLGLKIHRYSRPPLVATLEDLSSGKIFQIMVNHLERGNEEGRHTQAKKLNAYASGVSLPIIAMGDYNFDWDLNPGSDYRDAGYDYMTKNGVFSWVKPVNMIKTSCSPGYNSILDFAFVTSDVGEAASDILLRDAEYCEDDESKPDHRPVELLFSL